MPVGEIGLAGRCWRPVDELSFSLPKGGSWGHAGMEAEEQFFLWSMSLCSPPHSKAVGSSMGQLKRRKKLPVSFPQALSMGKLAGNKKIALAPSAFFVHLFCNPVSLFR